MPKMSKEEYMISELGNWNVANDFVREKIMKPLVKCDLYEDLAGKGFESIGDDLINWNSPPNDVIRISGLKWLVSELIKLIDNAQFAVKKGNTKQEILKYQGQLKKLKKVIPKLSKTKTNQIEGTRKIVIIDYVIFDDFLERVQLIKSKINEPLNKNNLIFVDTEEFDPQAYKEMIMKAATTRG